MRALSIDNPYSAEEINILQEGHTLKINELKFKHWFLRLMCHVSFVLFIVTLCSLFLILIDASWYDWFEIQSILIFIFYILHVCFEINSDRAKIRYRQLPALFFANQSPAIFLQQLDPDCHQAIIDFIIKIQNNGRALTHDECEFVAEQMKLNHCENNVQ
jgi:hypothetical protein